MALSFQELFFDSGLQIIKYSNFRFFFAVLSLNLGQNLQYFKLCMSSWCY